MRIAALFLAVAGVIAVGGCGTRGPVEPTYKQRHGLMPAGPMETEVESPSIGARTTVGIGEPMFSKGRQVQAVQLTIDEPLYLLAPYDEHYEYGIEIRPRTMDRYGQDRAGAEYFNVGRLKLRWLPKQGAPREDDVAVDVKRRADGELLVVWTYPGNDGYSVTEVAAPGLRARRGLGLAQGAKVQFRRELIYTGRAGQSLTLLYREFSNDMARPAFSQVLQYDIGHDPVIGYQGARFKVLQADNTSITYELLSHLAQ